MESVLSIIRDYSWGQVLSGKQWIIGSVERNEWPHYVWLQLIRRDLIQTHQLAPIPVQSLTPIQLKISCFERTAISILSKD